MLSVCLGVRRSAFELYAGISPAENETPNGARKREKWSGRNGQGKLVREWWGQSEKVNERASGRTEKLNLVVGEMRAYKVHCSAV